MKTSCRCEALSINMGCYKHSATAPWCMRLVLL